jgi:hypothetical protein
MANKTLKTLQDLRTAIESAPEATVRSCLRQIAELWLVPREDAGQTDPTLDPNTVLDSEALSSVTEILDDAGFWPEV